LILTLIIGKNSNLSKNIASKLDNYYLISSRDILNDVDILLEYKSKVINIIFNNFQSAGKLNSLDSAEEYVTNSIVTTSIILDYFKNTHINKIIYTSSSSVYGNNILCKESDTLNPINLHASLKIANEKLIEKYSIKRNIDYTITRIFNMYGGNDNFSIVSKIIKSYKNNEEITIVNNGNAIRDFIHIDDVVFIYKLLLDKKDIKILNIGTGTGISIKNIIEFLANHNIIIQTQNIFKNELKSSTSNSEIVHQFIAKDDFKRIEDYLIKEFVL
jgi:UDP-glucose 4-epimerase